MEKYDNHFNIKYDFEEINKTYANKLSYVTSNFLKEDTSITLTLISESEGFAEDFINHASSFLKRITVELLNKDETFKGAFNYNIIPETMTYDYYLSRNNDYEKFGISTPPLEYSVRFEIE